MTPQQPAPQLSVAVKYGRTTIVLGASAVALLAVIAAEAWNLRRTVAELAAERPTIHSKLGSIENRLVRIETTIEHRLPSHAQGRAAQ